MVGNNYNDQHNPDQDSQWVTAPQLVNEPCPPIFWVVEGILPVGGLSIIGARPKVGKSTLARSLAVAVAQGRQWLNRKVTQGRVMYINLEEHRPRVAEHFRKFQKIRDTEDLLLRFGPPPDDGIAWLKEQVKKHRPVLVIIDPMIDVIDVKDLSDYATVARALAPFLKIVWDTNAHITFIHHNTKADADQGRELLGSTALLARVDSVIILSKDSNKIRSFYSIQRNGDDVDPTELKLHSDGWITTGRTVSAAESHELQTEIIDFLQAQAEAVDTATIRNEVGHQAKQVSAALKSLAAGGKIIRSGKGRRGDAFKYEKI